MTIHIKKRWTEEEIKKIIDAYENGIPAEEIAVSLDRSSRSVRGKAFCLNLINRKHAEKHYTIEEDDYIRQHAQSMVRADIAKTLGRTEGSVSQRGRRLGVIFQNKKKNTKYQKKYDFFETPNLQNSYVACQWPFILTHFWPIKLTHPCTSSLRFSASVGSSLLPA